MHAGVARQPFQLQGEVDDLAHIGVVFIELLQLLFLLEGVLQLDANFEGNELGDAVAEAIALPQHAARIAHHSLRGHGAVGDDLRDTLATILLRYVFNNPVAAFHAEVDVEVRHRHAFGVQEALEQQVMLQGVEVRDAEYIGHQRTGTRTTPRPHGHAVFT